MGQLILGDIIGSRNHATGLVYSALNKITRKVNSKYNLKAPMMITLGDEFQLVAINQLQAGEIIEDIKTYLQQHNIECRFVSCRFYQDTSKYDTITKFNRLMIKHPRNPLIGWEFDQAHRELNKKQNQVVFLKVIKRNNE